MPSSVFPLLIENYNITGNYSITRYYRRAERKLCEVTPVKCQIKKSVAKVGHGVCQRKMQGQKREVASASGEVRLAGMGWGRKGTLRVLKEGSAEWKVKTDHH